MDVSRTDSISSKVAYDRLLSSVPEQERERMLSESVLIEVSLKCVSDVEKAGDGVEQGEVSEIRANDRKTDGEERAGAERARIDV